VGHTHINVDVPFGILKNWLKEHKLETLEDFLKALPSIFKNNKTIKKWQYLQIPKVNNCSYFNY